MKTSLPALSREERLKMIRDSAVERLRNIDYSRYVEFVGTAHFSRTSVRDAVNAVKEQKPTAICIELDKRRYNILRHMCRFCPERSSCDRKCEFIQATEALGNQDADIWLIDTTERQISRRISTLATYPEVCAWNRIKRHVLAGQIRGIRLWEEGLKYEAMKHFEGNLRLMELTFPSLYRILVTERNVLMACNLVAIANHYVKEAPLEEPRILALTGAAHVEGIRKLLKRRGEAFQLLGHLRIPIAPPHRIRRIRVD